MSQRSMACVVCASLCVSDTRVNRAKTAKPIMTLFRGRQIHVGKKNHVLRGDAQQCHPTSTTEQSVWRWDAGWMMLWTDTTDRNARWMSESDVYRWGMARWLRSRAGRGRWPATCACRRCSVAAGSRRHRPAAAAASSAVSANCWSSGPWSVTCRSTSSLSQCHSPHDTVTPLHTD